MPSSPDLQVLEDADDDGDDPASPIKATSKKFTARAETRNKRTQKKIDIQEALESAKRVNEERMAKQSARNPSASGSGSPPPSRSETPASQESDEFSPMARPSRASSRKKSFVWNHMNKDDKVTSCKHCSKTWFNTNVKSSTSNLRKHMIKQHHDKLSDADREYMTTGGQPSDKKTPQRALIKN